MEHSLSDATLHAIADGMGSMQATLTRKALSDGGFRQRLQAEPRRAIVELFGQDLPPGLVVHVHENAATALHVVVPPDLAQNGGLDDEELEVVAGGVTPALVFSVVTPLALSVVSVVV